MVIIVLLVVIWEQIYSLFLGSSEWRFCRCWKTMSSIGELF